MAGGASLVALRPGHPRDGCTSTWQPARGRCRPNHEGIDSTPPWRPPLGRGPSGAHHPRWSFATRPSSPMGNTTLSLIGRLEVPFGGCDAGQCDFSDRKPQSACPAAPPASSPASRETASTTFPGGPGSPLHRPSKAVYAGRGGSLVGPGPPETPASETFHPGRWRAGSGGRQDHCATGDVMRVSSGRPGGIGHLGEGTRAPDVTARPDDASTPGSSRSLVDLAAACSRGAQ